jgi:hypothetical protein
MACQVRHTYYRGCFHATFGITHTAACKDAMADLTVNGKVVPKCWNPMPSETKYIFVPCQCELCDPILQQFTWLALDRGDEGTVVQYNPIGPISNRGISKADIMMVARIHLECPEPKSMLERDRDAKALQARQQSRWREFNGLWAEFCADPDNQGDYLNDRKLGRGWLLDVKNGSTISSDGINNQFFRDVPNSEELLPDDVCICCRFPLRQMDDRDEEDTTEGQASGAVEFLGQAVMLPCGHKVHHRCCYKWFSSKFGKTNCMMCRREFKVILKNGFDDKEYQWVEEEERMCQIDGFILPDVEVLRDFSFKFFQAKSMDDWTYILRK